MPPLLKDGLELPAEISVVLQLPANTHSLRALLLLTTGRIKPPIINVVALGFRCYRNPNGRYTQSPAAVLT